MKRTPELSDDAPRPGDESWTVQFEESPYRFPLLARVGVTLAVATIVVILIVVAAPLLVPGGMTIGYAERLIGRVVGTEVRIEGDHSLRLLPTLRVEASDIVQVTPEGQAPAFSVKRLELDMGVFGIMSGSLNISALVLVDPVLRVSGRKGGEAAMTDAAGGSDWGWWRDMNLSGLRVRNGAIDIRDSAVFRPITVTELEISSVQPLPSDPADGIAVEGGAVMNGKKVAMRVATSSLQLLVSGSRWPLSVSFQSPLLNGSIVGALSLRQSVLGDGEFRLTSNDVGALDAWIGSILPVRGGNRMALSGRLDIADGAIKLPGLDIRLGETVAQADLGVMDAFAGAPRIEGTVRAETLDLGGLQRGADGPALDKPFEAPGVPEGWLEFSWRRALWRSHEFGPGKASLEREPGTQRVLLKLDDMYAYGGTLRGELVLDASEGMRAIKAEGKAVGIAVGAALGMGEVMAVPPIAGRGTIDLNVFSVGGSPRQLVQALTGEAEVLIRDGELNVPQLVSGLTADDAQNRPFTTLNGTFRIGQGVARSEDLILRSDGLSLVGKGTVDLADWHFDLDVGRVGAPGDAGVKRFKVSGPVEDIRVEALK